MEVGSCSYNYSNFDEPSSTAVKNSSRLTQSATDCSRYKDEEDEEQVGAGVQGLNGTGSTGLAVGSTGVFEEPIPKGWTSSTSRTPMASEPVDEPAACELQQEGGVALWVKWRGKWRACIQCYPSDCSAATAKAMPTYNQKTYVVVFFPNSRTYFWVDLQFACRISESPEPLAFGTHESGRRAVENLDMPKHHMLQVLTTSMLDISDRLPIKAVVRSAQNVKAWKDFANDAMKAKEYNDISNMLVRLFWMIDPSYYNKQWLKEGFANWKEACERANTAQAVETLNRDLVASVLWDDIQPLWDTPEQAAVSAEWKDWKYTMLEIKNLFPTVMPSPESTLYVDDSLAKRRRLYHAESSEYPSFDSAAKRSNLKVGPSPVLNSGGAAGGGRVVSTEHQLLEKVKPPATPASTLKMDEEPSPVWTSKRLASNYQLCSAYMEKKKRQCTRFPSQGSLFCCKHMALASGEAIEGVRRMDSIGEQRRPIVSEQKPVVSQYKSTTILPKSPNDRICEGNTKFGRRCTHRAREGSLFCKKHTFADAPHLNPESGERIADPLPPEVKNMDANGEQGEEKSAAASPSQQPEEPQAMNESEDQSKQAATSCGKRNPVSYFPPERSYSASWHAKRIGRLIKHNSGERVRCLGKCVNGEQCSHKSRPGFSYCEKHQPDASGEARPDSDGEIRKQDAAEVLVKAKSLLSGYMELANRKGDEENESALLRWILEEASRDPPLAQCLMKLVKQRKEKVGKFLELSGATNTMDVETVGEKSSGYDEGRADQEIPQLLPDEQQLEHLEKQLDKVKCSICSDDFDDMVDLGKHWKSSHTTEAHWFLKGYLCKECDKEFTNKSSFERHCKTVHEDAVEVEGVAVCINCDEQFSDFEALFNHVVASHADHLSAMPTISMPTNGDDMEPTKMDDDVQEQNNDESAAANGTKDEFGSESFEFPSSLEGSLDEVDGEREEYDDGRGPMRFKCKICSKRFKLLPELGRHHQLAHMPGQVATKLRNGAGSTRSSSKHEGVRRIKAALQSVQKAKAGGGDRVKLQQGPPDNKELMSAARAACCEANLQATLLQQYESVPKELLVKVLKLAGGVNVPKWTREGYVCARNCKQVTERAGDTRTHVFRKSNVIKKKSSVLCEDISFAREPMPIPCVEDEDTEQCTCSHCREGKSYYVDSERPWETFTYITKRMLDPSLGVDTKDSQIGCACGKHHCSAKSCLHVDLFDNDNAEASDIWGEEMSGRFPYDDQGRIILQEGYLVYECNTSCPCQPTCPNRILQRGVNVKLEVFKTRHKGWAVRAAQHIPRGTFVCEYLGEVLNDQEANRRGERYDQVGCSYLYDIDVHLNRGRSRRGPRVKPFVIDATRYGNVSRFMNHSCSPNLVNYQVLVESMDSRLAHIGLYASRDIACGEELSYDYRYKLLPGRGCPCHCGSSGCRGRLY